VAVALAESNETNHTVKSVTCEFDGSSHKGTVLATVLAKLDVGTTTIQIYSANTLDFDVNGWKVQALVRGGEGIAVPADVK
jgi:hypothetical protein